MYRTLLATCGPAKMELEDISEFRGATRCKQRAVHCIYAEIKLAIWSDKKKDCLLGNPFLVVARKGLEPLTFGL